MTTVVDNCAVSVSGGELPAEEIERYVARGREKYEGLHGIDINVDGDFVDLTYRFANQPFQRIRRITGYLVGTLDRFNDAKRAEEHDRVKHTL
jgi:hypothetical protein